MSPTWGLADILKPADKEQRAGRIRKLNALYFWLSIAIASGIVVAERLHVSLPPASFSWWSVAVQWVILWRPLEVLRAFYDDARDKLARKPSSSALSPENRVLLALRSYGELVLDFALIYGLMPASAWVRSGSPPPPPEIMGDMIWYSANVITTSGGGGFVPASLWLKALTLGELVCGVVLLVVCFTIYASMAIGSESDDRARE